ncbi:LysM peptidoglycan-binding domain-containing protein [Pedobacter antarcticus]|uniref:LysM peptidoglycan-binding domain-containing protein n=1 Tax=Pedobacter antarcticus TaxID=34086 RepID=UPI001C561DB2|nr:LysM peptidoglycan-binding domain-containing protein [Pedobacter antarcticus]
MQKYYIVFLFAGILGVSETKADTLRDSIGVENLKGKKLIVHQVVAKDTYYSISRRYNVAPKEIMTFNDNKYLSLGAIIKIPTQIPFIEAQQPSSISNNAGPGETTTHTVEPKDNLNMLARKYGTTVNELKRLNDLHTINLKIGQVLIIPQQESADNEKTTAYPEVPVRTTVQTDPKPNIDPIFKRQDTSKRQETVKKAEVANPGQQPPAQDRKEIPAKNQLIVHTVASNETMYSIATKYNLTLDQLKAKNNLTTNSLYVGQKLLVNGQYPTGNEMVSERDNVNTDTLESVKDPSLRLPASRYGLSQMEEKGTAAWIQDPDLDSSKMLVLHRTAPIGTVIKITNPMSNRSTFAKVVGKFTENESTKDVIIVMTKAVADALGALDKRFLCNLTYSGQANEQQ